MSNSLYFRAYSESKKLPFLIGNGMGLSIILMLIVAFFNSNTSTNHPVFVIVFFLIFTYAWFVSFNIQFGTSIRLNTVKNELVIHTFGYKKVKYDISSVNFRMERSERTKEMENALTTNAGEYFIPQGFFFNTPKKMGMLREILDKIKTQ